VATWCSVSTAFTKGGRPTPISARFDLAPRQTLSERELALIPRGYTKTAVLDLASGEVIAEETESSPGAGFCPVGCYGPDWWDVNDDSIIPGSEYWDGDKEWPTGLFRFVWGCYWGDDTSWKVQHLDLTLLTASPSAR
jgi:hypothetical protein